MTDMEEIKPCPFCGSTTLEVDRCRSSVPGFKEYWFVTCYDCPCRGVQAETRDEAIAAWNTRPNEDNHD